MVHNGSRPHSQSVPGLGHIKLSHRADVPGVKLLKLHLLLAPQGIHLADLLLGIFIYIIRGGIRL